MRVYAKWRHATHAFYNSLFILMKCTERERGGAPHASAHVLYVFPSVSAGVRVCVLSWESSD